MSIISCQRAVTQRLEKQIFDGIKNLNDGELGSHACSLNAAHVSRKPTTNTPTHAVNLRAITSTQRQKLPNHSIRAVSTWSLERSVALVGYAMSAQLLANLSQLM